jgi:hypothetical protein
VCSDRAPIYCDEDSSEAHGAAPAVSSDEPVG